MGISSDSTGFGHRPNRISFAATAIQGRSRAASTRGWVLSGAVGAFFRTGRVSRLAAMTFAATVFSPGKRRATPARRMARARQQVGMRVDAMPLEKWAAGSAVPS